MNRALSTTLVAGLLYLSPIVGLVSDIVVVRLFGLSSALDLYRLVISLMLISAGQIASGMVRYLIIPELSAFHAANDDRGGLRYSITIIGLGLALIGIPLAAAFLWPVPTLTLFAPGLDPAIINEGVTLVRVGCAGVVMMICFGGLNAILQFYGFVYSAALSQLFQNVVFLSVILVSGSGAESKQEQVQTFALALGTSLFLTFALAGALFVVTLRRRDRPAPAAEPIRAGLTRLHWMSFLFQMVVTCSDFTKSVIANRSLSEISEGSVAIYSYAYRLLLIGYLPAVAFVTVLFPAISRLHASGSAAETSKTFVSSLLYATASSMFLTLFLFGCADRIAESVFLFAKFAPHEMDELVSVYRVLLLSTFGAAVGLLFLETAYAFRLQVAILSASLISCAVAAFAIPVLARHLGIMGVVIGFLLITYATTGVLAARLFVHLKGLPPSGEPLGRFFGWWIVACGLLFLVAVEGNRMSNKLVGHGLIENILVVGILGLVALVAYVPLSCRALGIRSVRDLLRKRG